MTLQASTQVLAPHTNGEVTVASYLRHNVLAISIAAAGFVALFWPTLRGLVGYWYEDPDFSHGFLIPVISGVILFANRKDLGDLAARRSMRGLVILVVSIVVLLAGSLSFTNILERLALWGAIVGAVVFVLGPALVRRKPFPFFFLLLAIPPPFFLLTPLRLALKGFATRLSADVLLALGYGALPQGNVLSIGEHRLEVADACSGVRSLMAIVSTAVLFAYLFRTGFWKGAALTATAIPITVAVNILRIIIIAVALVSFQVDLTQGAAHELVGFAVFSLSLGLLYASWRFYDWLFRWNDLEGHA
jgi:exosortase